MEQKNVSLRFQIGALSALVLLMPGWQLGGISARIWLVWLVVAAGGVLLLKSKQNHRRKWTALDCLLGGCLVWNFLQIITSAVRMENCDENNLLGIGLVILFFLASMIESRPRILMEVLLICAVPVYAGLLWHFLGNPSNTFDLMPLLEDEALVPFLLLVNIAAEEGYCKVQSHRNDEASYGKYMRWFYMAMALTGYFLLFIDGNIMGIILAGMSFPVSILLHRPEKEFVRRIMQMTFTYLFLLSNMSLLVNYMSLIKVDVVYSLEDSAYLELGIALAGVIFFSWWDKLPEGEDVILNGLQKGISWFLSGAGICLFLLLAMGSRLEGMGDSTSMTLLRRFSDAMREYCAGHNGSFFDALASGGIVGGLWVVCAVLLSIKQLMRQVRLRRVEAVSLMVFILYLGQTVFFSHQAASAPIYVVFLAGALCGRGRILDEEDKGLFERVVEIFRKRKKGVEGLLEEQEPEREDVPELDEKLVLSQEPEEEMGEMNYVE